MDIQRSEKTRVRGLIMLDFLTTTIEMPLWLVILNTLILALVLRDSRRIATLMRYEPYILGIVELKNRKIN